MEKASKKQSSKRGKMFASKIRQVARKILEQGHDGSMNVTELWLKVRDQVDTPMRSDFLILNLLRGEGFSISRLDNRTWVSLKNTKRKEVKKAPMKKASKKHERLTPEQFVIRAIERLRLPESKGIHAVFSGFNEAFRTYFEGLDPVEEVKKLVNAGIIVTRPAKGGVMLYPAGTVESTNRGSEALVKMGLKF